MSDIKAKILTIAPEDLKAKGKSLSSVIRYLGHVGFSRTEISKMLDIRYQHVRNTELQKLKQTDLKDQFDEIECKILANDQLNLL